MDEMMTVSGTIDGVPAELDRDPADPGAALSGRLELDRYTWQTLDPADESDRKLIDRFEESA